MTLDRYKEGKYHFSHYPRKGYTYEEMRKYFFIDGSEVIYCKKDFKRCKAGQYYLVADGYWGGFDFIVETGNKYFTDVGVDDWEGKEYMKHDVKQIQRGEI